MHFYIDTCRISCWPATRKMTGLWELLQLLWPLLGALLKSWKRGEVLRNWGLWLLHRQFFSTCQHPLPVTRNQWTTWWPITFLAWWRNRPKLWMPSLRRSMATAWGRLLPASLWAQVGPAQGIPTLWFPKPCLHQQLLCPYLHLGTLLHLGRKNAPRPKACRITKMRPKLW